MVEAKTGPDSWRIRIDGRPQIVTTTLDLVPGQQLRLKLESQTPGLWILRTWPPALPPKTGVPEILSNVPEALMTAFLSRGLPLASEKLSQWTRWNALLSGPSDREGWAASLESRNLGPYSSDADRLAPWLAWQTALEAGQNPPPPQDSEYWDQWNTRQTAQGAPWLVLPLRWEYRGTEDAGLLQAHWNPQAGAIDAWNLTAAPAGLAFRLEAVPKSLGLDLTWRFFDPPAVEAWVPLAQELAQSLSTPELVVSLRVTGPSSKLGVGPRGGLDVQV